MQAGTPSWVSSARRLAEDCPCWRVKFFQGSKYRSSKGHIPNVGSFTPMRWIWLYLFLVAKVHLALRLGSQCNRGSQWDQNHTVSGSSWYGESYTATKVLYYWCRDFFHQQYEKEVAVVPPRKNQSEQGGMEGHGKCLCKIHRPDKRCRFFRLPHNYPQLPSPWPEALLILIS